METNLGVTNGNGQSRIQGQFPKTMYAPPQLTTNQFQEFKELVQNAMWSRAELFRKLLDGVKDIDGECGYPKIIGSDQYRLMYEREPIGTRVVEVLPNESWQATPDVYESEDEDEETEFEVAWKDLAKALRGKSFFQDQDGNPVWEHLKRADVLSGIGCYGVILLGIDDGLPLNQPIQGFEDWVEQATNPEPNYPQGTDAQYNQPIVYKDIDSAMETGAEPGAKVGQKKPQGRRLLFLRSFPEDLAQITQWEGNTSSPRFGQPLMYSITFNDPRDGGTAASGLNTSTNDVHWSRIIHIADNLGSSEVIGRPRQEPVFNRLLDLRKLYGGSAEMYWHGALPGLSIESHPQLGGDVDLDEVGIKRQVQDYRNGLQRLLMITGAAVKTLSPTVVDPTPQIKVQIEAICIKIGVPQRVFMGSERGELASSQDDSTWNDRLHERRTGYLTPRVIVPFIDRCILIGVLSEPEGYSVSWPDLNTLKPLEQAQVTASRTDAMTKYVSGGLDALMAPLDWLTREMGFKQEEAVAILEATLEHLEEANPDTEGEIVPGRQPPPPPEDPDETPIKLKEGEGLVTKEGEELIKPKRIPEPSVNVETTEVGDPKSPFDGVENFNPTQPRVPTGPHGGEWTKGASGPGGKPLPAVRKKKQLPTDNEGGCGTGAGGFKPGNTCAKGSSSSQSKRVFGGREFDYEELESDYTDEDEPKGIRMQLYRTTRPGESSLAGTFWTPEEDASVAYAKERGYSTLKFMKTRIPSAYLADEDTLREIGLELEMETDYLFEVADSSEAQSLLRQRGFKVVRFNDLAPDNATEHETILMLNLRSQGKSLVLFLADPAKPIVVNDCGTGSGGFKSGNVCARGSVKSERAKLSAVRVASDIQRYSEEHNEPILAKALRGKSLPDNEPVDVVTVINGKNHGVELKTMTVGANRKITMKGDAIARKRKWEKQNKGICHTVVFDDTKVFNSKGEGQHDFTQRKIYYRRGYGSFRVDKMHLVKDTKELRKLLTLNRKQLTPAAGGTKKQEQV